MSSTNRGYDRHKSDYYVTPLEPIREFLVEFLVDEKIDRPDRLYWLDACAGGEVKEEQIITHMSYPVILEELCSPVVITTLDIREDSPAEIKSDYLTWNKHKDEYDIIITNPPFNLAEQVIRKALSDVKDSGYVIMLLRLNFFGSVTRKPLWEEFMPKYCYVAHKRISFIKGSTDSVEYGHFVWQKGYTPEFTKLKVI